jgi:hypothetical protein
MRNKFDLFTTNYGVYYDNWVKQEDGNRKEGFYDTFKRGDYTIHVSVPVFYLLVQIVDPNGKVVFYDYIYQIRDYLDIKKKLKWK